MKMNNKMYFFLSIITTVACHPVISREVESKEDVKDEQRYPNGTVIGKYSYTDNDGNPIQVKYYADDTSYGVELKSVKVINGDSSTLKSNESFESVPNIIEKMLNVNNPVITNKYKINGPNVKDTPKHNHYKGKASPDYDIYLPNEVKAPKKCTNEKVHIYFDKKSSERKIRSALNNYEVSKICEQF